MNGMDQVKTSGPGCGQSERKRCGPDTGQCSSAVAGQIQGCVNQSARPPTPIEEASRLLDADRKHRNLAADQTLMLNMVMPYFRQSVTQLSQGLFRWFQHQGFWPAGQRFEIESAEQTRFKKMEKLGLIVTEVAEAMEAVRKGDTINEAEELADTLVRLFDYAGGFDIPLAEAFHEKMIKNYGRPFRHNKHF